MIFGFSSKKMEIGEAVAKETVTAAEKSGTVGKEDTFEEDLQTHLLIHGTKLPELQPGAEETIAFIQEQKNLLNKELSAVTNARKEDMRRFNAILSIYNTAKSSLFRTNPAEKPLSSMLHDLKEEIDSLTEQRKTLEAKIHALTLKIDPYNRDKN